MNAKTILVALMALIMTVSCNKKEEETTNNGNNNDPITNEFVGTYDLKVTTDSVMTDNDWFDTPTIERLTGKTYPDQFGTMTITATDNPKVVNVLARISADGITNLYDYYVTTGSINEAGDLILNDSEALLGGETPVTFTYNAIHPNQPLTFKSHAYFIFAELNCGYVHTNTATKR